jgi:hypothetical protein
MARVSTPEHDPDAVEAFWKGLDEALRDGGNPSAEEISAQLQAKRNYSVSASTVRGWLTHRRLPRKDDDFFEVCLLLLARPRADQLMGLLQAARQARVQPTAPPPAEDRPSDPPGAPRGRGRSRTLRSVAALVGVGAVGALVGLSYLTPTGDESVTGTPSRRAPVPDASSSSTATPDNSPCPSPPVRAESSRRSASATFCADQKLFLLSDDDADSRSAILVVRVNGAELPAWFNSDKHATRGPDGRLVVNPPRPIPITFADDATADFRVCVGKKNPERTYPEETCGTWTPAWPRR